MKLLRLMVISCCLLAAVTSFGAAPPFMQLIGAPGAAAFAAGSCDSDSLAPGIRFDADLGPGDTYRYSPAIVTPNFFDDEGEFNLIWNQDSTLLVSPFLPSTG